MFAGAAPGNYQGVTRAVCIGLGGSGMQTIMRLRRLIVERYGSLDRFPIVRFVLIDTDSGALDNANLGGRTFHRGVDISLTDNEKVHIGMIPTDADALRIALKNPQKPTPYDHIGEWLPDSVIDNAGAIDKGAGGIRPVGRLAFFHNYGAIKSAITSAEMQTRGSYPHLMTDFGLIQDNGLDIFIVGSLYGGTGSGTFLDVAYAVRNIYPNNKVFGYLVVNPELATKDGNGFDQQANIYAALMELDFYSRGNEFNAFYDRNDPQSKIQSNGRPPFNYAFLVGRNTDNEKHQIAEKDKLFNLIAQKIAAEFASSFAPKLKEKRDDFDKHLQQDDNHPRPNPQHYLTFGLSEIYCPIDRIIEITSARVSVLLMQFWQTGIGQAPDIMSLMLTFYTTYDWYKDINQRLGFPEKKLDTIPLEGNNTSNTLMTAWKSRCEKNVINNCKSSSDRESLAAQLKNDFRQQFRKVEIGDSDAMRGEWLTTIMRGVPSSIAKYKQDIKEFQMRLLNPRDVNFSIANALAWVSKLTQDLNDNCSRLVKEIGTLGAEKTLEGLESHWQKMAKEIEAENREFGWFGLRNKNQSVKAIALKYLEETRKAIEHNRKIFVAKQSLEITDILSRYCGELSAGLTISKNKAVEIEVEYRTIETERRDMNLNELNGEAIFTEQDVIDAEQALIPEIDRLSNYQQITDELFKVLQIDRSLVELLQQISVNDTVDKMDQVLKSIFSNRILSFGRPVIEAFLEKYQPIQPVATKRLSDILSMAEPRLALESNDPYCTAGNRKRFVGFCAEQTSSVNRFKSLLVENQVVDTINLINKDRVVIITEFAPFPLRIIKGIANYGFQYKLRIDQNKALHNDKRVKFTNIIPPSNQEMIKLQSLFFPCLALGFFGNYQQQNLEFEYWSQRFVCLKTDLLQGNWDQCMESISSDRDLFDSLAVELSGFEDGLTLVTWGKGITREGTDNGAKATIDSFQKYISDLSGYNKRYLKQLTDKDGILDKYRQKIDRMLSDRAIADPTLTESQSNQTKTLTGDKSDDQPIDAESIDIS